MKAHWSKKLELLGACSEAVEYARTQPSLAAAWAACERGDWMLWLLGELSGKPNSKARRKLVGVAAECAALALPIYEKRYPKDTRVRDCLDACRRYAAGKIDVEELCKYADTADTADTAAADTAYAAAATAAAAARAAARAAAYAYAACGSARDKTLATCASIVRADYPKAPVIKVAA